MKYFQLFVFSLDCARLKERKREREREREKEKTNRKPLSRNSKKKKRDD